MRRTSCLSFVILTISLFCINTASFADTAQKGLNIAKEAKKRASGFQSFTSSLDMMLVNKRGQTNKRKLRSRTLESTTGSDKSILIFDTPSDVKGTVFLSHAHKTKSNDQWLYLPALKRVKRISSSNQSGPFMSSEFSYEDITSQEISKYTYDFVKSETVKGIQYFVIKRFPMDKKSGYTSQVLWIDQQEYRTHKIDFYDRKKSLLKTLINSDFQKYNGQHWRPHKMNMVNHQTGKSTTLSYSDFKFKVKLSDKDFTKSSIKKIK
jgi:outer membrane lipoprotein-sorting protein